MEVGTQGRKRQAAQVEAVAGRAKSCHTCDTAIHFRSRPSTQAFSCQLRSDGHDARQGGLLEAQAHRAPDSKELAQPRSPSSHPLSSKQPSSRQRRARTRQLKEPVLEPGRRANKGSEALTMTRDSDCGHEAPPPADR